MQTFSKDRHAPIWTMIPISMTCDPLEGSLLFWKAILALAPPSTCIRRAKKSQEMNRTEKAFAERRT